MADVSHELGSIRHIVDSPLSSKVAMFNKVANQHNASQLLNPFANIDGRASPKPSFSKDEYGKPLAGSLTEMRGQKANIHVCKEMLELCQVIDSEGFPDQEDPNIRIIFFGDLFNIYNYISDKVVGLLLRARKHKLVDFEGEMLFQRRDDEVPIFLIKPIREIRAILEAKQEEFRRSVSPAPQPTTVLLQNHLKNKISTRSAPTSKASSPQPDNNKKQTNTASVTSLTADDKPPTGQIVNANSTEKMVNGTTTPPIKEQTQVTINITETPTEDQIKEAISKTSTNSSNATDAIKESKSELSNGEISNAKSIPSVETLVESPKQIVELEKNKSDELQKQNITDISTVPSEASVTSDLSRNDSVSTIESVKTVTIISVQEKQIEEFKRVEIENESLPQSQGQTVPQPQSEPKPVPAEAITTETVESISVIENLAPQ